MNDAATLSTAPVLIARGVAKSYVRPGGRVVEVLRNLSLEVAGGGSVAVVGVSGVGKSTLLHLLGALDSPDRGEIFFEGRDISRLDEEARAAFRRKSVGYIFQHHGLLPEFTALENTAMPLLIAGVSMKVALERTKPLLEAFGLGGRLEHFPSELSAGEAQRAAVARALVHAPNVILADEPTGNLDEETARDVFDALLQAVKERNIAFLVVTHNPSLARLCCRVLRLRHGTLHREEI